MPDRTKLSVKLLEIDVGPPLYTLLQPEIPMMDGVEIGRCDQPLKTGQWGAKIINNNPLDMYIYIYILTTIVLHPQCDLRDFNTVKQVHNTIEYEPRMNQSSSAPAPELPFL